MDLIRYIWSYAWLPSVPVPILVVAGIAVWLVAAVAVGGWIGRVIRRRDEEAPREPGGLIATPENADERREERELW